MIFVISKANIVQPCVGVSSVSSSHKPLAGLVQGHFGEVLAETGLQMLRRGVGETREVLNIHARPRWRLLWHRTFPSHQLRLTSVCLVLLETKPLLEPSLLCSFPSPKGEQGSGGTSSAVRSQQEDWNCVRWDHLWLHQGWVTLAASSLPVIAVLTLSQLNCDVRKANTQLLTCRAKTGLLLGLFL